MDESFAALAVIELPGGPVGADAGQRGHVEHPPQSAIVAFRPVQIAADAARIPWHRDQSGVGRQSAGGGEGCQVAAGSDDEFRAEVGSEAGQRLDDLRVRVIAEAFGDGFVDVFDLAVEVEQLAGQPFDQGGGAGLAGQSERAAGWPSPPRWPRSWRSPPARPGSRPDGPSHPRFRPRGSRLVCTGRRPGSAGCGSSSRTRPPASGKIEPSSARSRLMPRTQSAIRSVR